jgi:MFS transporter, ACS family, tartrate transporter
MSVQESALSKARWRLLPFLLLCYLCAYLDRANVGVAALQMNKSLGFTPTVYAFGAGIFFLSYFALEIPSNWAMERVGTRRWIARIMLTWGVLASCTAFVWDAQSFYVVRFFLGAAEAGLLPGVIVYLTRWFPARERAGIMGMFFLGLPLSFVIGAPISGALLGLDGVWGLAGWKWLFLLEGLPTVILGFLCLRVLTNTPAEAQWLEPEEREWLTNVIRAEAAERAAQAGTSFASALRSPAVWIYGVTYIGIVMGIYGIGLWLPQIIKQLGHSDFVTSVISAVPYLVGAIVMMLWAHSADRRSERRWSAVIPPVVASLGLVASACISDPVLSLVAVGVATVGIMASMPTFWALPMTTLSGPAASSGAALVNSLGNLGGFAGPFLVGYLRQATNSFTVGLLFLGACPMIAAIVLYFMSGSCASQAGGDWASPGLTRRAS